MASSINASTTSGIVQTADTSGILNLQSNGTTVASVSSTGLAVTGTLSASGALTAISIGGNITQSNSVTTVVAGSTTAGTYTDSGASLSLAAGTYLITTTAMIGLQTQSGTTVAFRLTKLALTDNSNNIQQTIWCGGTSTGFGLYTGTLSFVLTVPSTTTYKTRFTSENNSGSPTISNMYLYGTAEYPHNIIATRLT